MLVRKLALASLLLCAAACGGSKKSTSQPITDAGQTKPMAADSSAPKHDAGAPVDAGHSQIGDAGADASADATVAPVTYDLTYGGAGPGVDSRPGVNPVFDSGGALISYTASADEAPALGTCHVAEVGGDEMVHVGRWNGGKMSGTFYPNTYSFGVNEGFHYAVGVRSTSIPSSGTSSYNLLSATAPTLGGGAFKPGSVSGNAKIAWGDTPRVAVDLTFKIPGDATYHVVTQGGLADPSQSELDLSSSTAPFSIGVDFARGLFIPLSSTGAACATAVADDAGTSSCMATIYGWLLGTQADHLGMSIVVVSPNNAAHALHGALSFKRR